MNLPTVLRIQRIVKLPRVEPVVCALIKRQRTSHQKITEEQPGDRPIERRRADGIDAGPVIQPLLENRSAESELMRSSDPTDIVENGRHWSIVLRTRRCGAASERECASGCDGNDFSSQGSHVRSKVGP